MDDFGFLQFFSGKALRLVAKPALNFGTKDHFLPSLFSKYYNTEGHLSMYLSLCGTHTHIICDRHSGDLVGIFTIYVVQPIVFMSSITVFTLDLNQHFIFSANL